MASPINKNPRISVKRSGAVIGEYHPLQMGSLLETGHLKREDLCLDSETGEWLPLRSFLEKGGVPGYSRQRETKTQTSTGGSRRSGSKDRRLWVPLMTGFFALAVASGAFFWSWKASSELAGMQARLTSAEAANAEWEKKYQNVLFAAREVAAKDQVRGRVIIRNPTGKRITLPGIKVRLFSRADLEAYLADRYDRIAEAGGTDQARLSLHFLKSMPLPLETTTTDSDGRFELKVPTPGEYILQTSIRSAKSGEMRLWFVAFDSRDPLNTPVDITESNVVRQFNPFLMINDGR
ncbi:MAG: hypothetical protein ACOYM3_05755 [Terrimicrobiaceae bacterium]